MGEASSRMRPDLIAERLHLVYACARAIEKWNSLRGMALANIIKLIMSDTAGSA